MSFGVTSEGFSLKTLEDILTELSDAEKAAFGAAFNTQADSVAGQLNAILGDQLAQLWLVALAVYRSLYPDSASEEALDNVAAITGAIRLAAAPSTVDLKLNLANGTTVPAGSKVAIGTGGEQWVTLADAENAGADPATISVEAESVNDGPIVGNERAIDTIITPISGWSAKAALTNDTDETYTLANGQTLIVEVDGVENTITFATGDFVDITAATAQEVVDAINADITGAVASEVGGYVRLTSDTEGEGSSIQCTGGMALAALGFSRKLVQGFNWNEPPTVDSVAGPFDLANNETLIIEVDGVERTVTFVTGDFSNIDAATALEVAAKINSSLSDAEARVYDGDKVRIESLTAGVNGTLEVTGGTATNLGFPSTLAAGTSGDADLGRDTETDAAFRLRRAELLSISGASTVESIRSAVRALTGVDQAYVFENTTDVTDGDGLPPHSIEVVVSGGDDTTIAEEIFAVKPAGIETYRDPGASGVTVSVTDSQGFSRDINFTRPTELEMYIEIDITVDASAFGGGDEAEGVDQVKDALVALGAELQIGDDVIINKFLAAAIEVAGVTDVTAVAIEDADPPLNTSNIVLATREIALFAAARITVNVS